MRDWRLGVLLLVLSTFVMACNSAPSKEGTSDPKERAPQQEEVKEAAQPQVPEEVLEPESVSDVVEVEEAAPAFTAPTGEVILPCMEEDPEGMRCVAGGPFQRGVNEDPFFPPKRHQPSYNRTDQPNSTPQAEVWMQTYYMDRTEVTYGAYQACVKEGKCTKARPLYRDFDRPNQPMSGMDWFQARDYCLAQGKHLPTEAEWEKAARGPEGALHPWGDEGATCDLAVIKNKKGRSCGIQKVGHRPEAGRVLEVCSKPPGVYDLCDMVGNAEEWVADWYSNSWESCGEDCLGFHPKGPCGGADECDRRYRSVRGGSWYWGPDHATSIHRRSQIPENAPKEKMHHFGFRCAASVEEARLMVGESDE